MGDYAGNVPIEPDSQSNIANATEAVPGVITCGVPGAGGYDALHVLYLKGNQTYNGKSDSVRDEIAQLWRNLSCTDEVNICPLTVRCATNEWGGIQESTNL